MRKNTNWKEADIDWSKDDAEISEETGKSRPDVNQARQRLAPHTLKRYKDPLDQYLEVSSEERKKVLNGLLGEAARNIEEASKVFTSMQASGDNLQWIPKHVRMMLGRVAAKTMLPEVMFGIGGRLRARVMLLPLADQERVMTGEKFKVAVGDTFEYIEPRNLTIPQVEQVFSESGSIRTLDQQKAWIEGMSEKRKQKEEQRKRNLPHAHYKIDTSAKGIVIDRPGLISIEELKEIVKTHERQKGN